MSTQKEGFQFRELRVSFILLILARLKNLTQHFGILRGIFREGIGDERGEVSEVKAA
jgi:hypothetical protein